MRLRQPLDNSGQKIDFLPATVPIPAWPEALSASISATTRLS
jgi:hypothetical protein